MPEHTVTRESTGDTYAAIQQTLAALDRGLDRVLEERAALLHALKAMVASYDGIRNALTCPTVIAKLAVADAAIAKAEGRS